MRKLELAALVAVQAASVALVPACTPDIDTDPQPEVMEFDPASGRVAEPSFAVINPVTRLIDLSLGGITVPPECTPTTLPSQAQCEFLQYLQSLDGFPTSSAARTPASAALDPVSLTAQNVAAFDLATMRPLTAQVTVVFDPVSRYLQVAPMRSWAPGSFVWIGVRGYANGVRAGGKEVVASLAYNLLKREESLACQPAAETCAVAVVPAAIPATCPYFQLLAQQMAPAAAQANIAQLEQLRCAIRNTFHGWEALAALGGIPKAEAAMLWGFPTHSSPVIELDPAAGLVPQVVPPSEIRLAVNGELDPATVNAYRLGQNEGSVYLLNVGALATNMIGAGFPSATATYAAGVISVKSVDPLPPGAYAVIVSRSAKSPTGKALVPPPAVMLALARGPIVNAAGVSQVTSVSNAQAVQLEQGRLQLAPLVNDPMFAALTRLSRETIAYVFSFTVGAP
jgi:hypothetical protein